MGSTSYIHESFVDYLLRMSMPQSEVAVRLRLNVLCSCTSEACKYSISAVVMAAAVTSSSSATLGIERFTSVFARKVYEQMPETCAWHWSKVEAWNLTVKTLKLVNSMKAYFLFVGVKSVQEKRSGEIVQEQTPETCAFHGWCFKIKEY